MKPGTVNLDSIFPKEIMKRAVRFRAYDWSSEDLLTSANNLLELTKRVYQIYEGAVCNFVCEACGNYEVEDRKQEILARVRVKLSLQIEIDVQKEGSHE